jgi:anti-sigma regulatory factor (Ser/Thr protein kinase)
VAEQRTLDVASLDGLPTFTRMLPRAKESAPLARRLVTELLSQWELLELVDDAALVLDELVANAADHARGASIRITITRRDHTVVRLAVADLEHKRPRIADAGPDDEGGRGMYLVAGLSRRWGVDPLSSGKRVWADVAVAR